MKCLNPWIFSCMVKLYVHYVCCGCCHLTIEFRSSHHCCLSSKVTIRPGFFGIVPILTTCPEKNNSSPGTPICPVFWLGVLSMSWFAHLCSHMLTNRWPKISSDFIYIHEKIAGVLGSTVDHAGGAHDSPIDPQFRPPMAQALWRLHQWFVALAFVPDCSAQIMVTLLSPQKFCCFLRTIATKCTSPVKTPDKSLILGILASSWNHSRCPKLSDIRAVHSVQAPIPKPSKIAFLGLQNSLCRNLEFFTPVTTNTNSRLLFRNWLNSMQDKWPKGRIGLLPLPEKHIFCTI